MNAVASNVSPATPEAFRALFKTHAAGVAIVTANVGSGPVGFTVTSIASVCPSPPVVAFSIMESSSCWPAISRAATVVAHFLDEDHLALAQRFAMSGVNRFEGVQWETLPSGAPRLLAIRRWAPCVIIDKHATGASHVILATLGTTVVEAGPGPLLYWGQGYHRLGSEMRRTN